MMVVLGIDAHQRSHIYALSGSVCSTAVARLVIGTTASGHRATHRSMVLDAWVPAIDATLCCVVPASCGRGWHP